jgi:hypothetical protein
MAFGADTPLPESGMVETVMVDERVVACDGSDGPLGHPRLAAHRRYADLLPLLLARVRAAPRRGSRPRTLRRPNRE